MNSWTAILGDATHTGLPDQCVDLVVGSPPYSGQKRTQRTYGIDFNLVGQDWVDWMVEVFIEGLRICRGPVFMVVEGATEDHAWSATPALLMADLHRKGITLRKPPIYRRFGIPGSGGKEWLRNDYEFIICATNGGRLPWSDNTAMGHEPKYKTGGRCSNRTADGRRFNEKFKALDAIKPSSMGYAKPDKANPGNVIKQTYTAEQVADLLSLYEFGDVTDHKVGGGLMGHELAHENEAPFPETLADFLIRTFCPPGGTVADLFCGSGTTLAAAFKAGRDSIGIDIRQSQVDLTIRRLNDVQLLRANAQVPA